MLEGYKNNIITLRDRIASCWHHPDDNEPLISAGQPLVKNQFCMVNYKFECGSPACIAGHAMHLWPVVTQSLWEILEDDEENDTGINQDIVARELLVRMLGVTEHQAKEIAMPGIYEECFYPDSYEDITPKQAVDMLNNLLETGEVKWC